MKLMLIQKLETLNQCSENIVIYIYNRKKKSS